VTEHIFIDDIINLFTRVTEGLKKEFVARACELVTVAVITFSGHIGRSAVMHMKRSGEWRQAISGKKTAAESVPGQSARTAASPARLRLAPQR
jgi:hypothetical protein